MINNQVYTTLSNYETHIAIGNKYVGKVNSYQNPVTRFLSKLFRISMEVDFNGKTKTVNKNEYKKLVKFLLNKEINISESQFRKFNSIVDDKLDLSHVNKNQTMRDAIGSKKSFELFVKLAIAIRDNNMNQASKLIGKGANLEQEFYISEKDRTIAFGRDYDAINHEGTQKIFKLNPLLIAAQKENSELVQKLIDFGAKIDHIGSEYLLEKRYQRDYEQVDVGYDGMVHYESREIIDMEKVETKRSPASALKFNVSTKKLEKIES